MSMFYLLFSKPIGGFTPISVVCASTKNTDRLTGNRLTFAIIKGLEKALDGAGVSEYESKIPLSAIRSGISSFLPVTADVANKLGLLNP